MLQIKIYREARMADMPLMKLFARELAREELYKYILLLQGSVPKHPGLRMWICEIDNELVGMAIGNVEEDTMPVLLIHPGFIDWDIGSRLTELVFGLEPKHDNTNILPLLSADNGG